MSIKRLVETWGTVVVIEATSTALDEVTVSAAVDEVEQFFYQVDRDFSTYKEDSQVSRIRRGELKIEDSSEYVQQVWALCVFSRELTLGAFDPWKAEGGFDPSGLVKGWAADKCADIVQAYGAKHVLVNAAGDLTLRGGTLIDGVVTPWSIGVVNPDNRQETVKHFQISDGAVATSGTYEKGAHIVDPHTGMIAIGAKSATVIGPDGALADALATALMVEGRDGAAIFGNPELAQYSAWVIDRYGDVAWSLGPLAEGRITP